MVQLVTILVMMKLLHVITDEGLMVSNLVIWLIKKKSVRTDLFFLITSLVITEQKWLSILFCQMYESNIS